MVICILFYYYWLYPFIWPFFSFSLNTVNTEGKYGACGFIPIINRYSPFPLLPTYIIRIDDEMNVVRDENGLCVQCDIGEPGLIVGQISRSTKQDYAGYANSKEASEKKIVRDLFRKGQNAFNSGDMCVMDWEGYIYFVDRLGDTYRYNFKSFIFDYFRTTNV